MSPAVSMHNGKSGLAQTRSAGPLAMALHSIGSTISNWKPSIVHSIHQLMVGVAVQCICIYIPHICTV